MTPQPKEQSHSALPVIYADDFGGIRVKATGGRLFEGVHGKEQCAMAYEISARCNSHARLLAQNEMLRKSLERIEAQRNNRYESTVGIMADIARATLEQTGEI